MSYPEGVPSDIALITIIVNVLLPGIGTMIAGCSGTGKGGGAICIGIIQMLLSIFIIGWIWAVVWSVNLYKKSKEEEALKPNLHTTHAMPVSQPPPAHYPEQGQNPPTYAQQGQKPPMSPQQGQDPSMYPPATQ